MRNNKALGVTVAIITALAAAASTVAFFMKRHAKKGKYTACMLIAAAILCATPITAYAYDDSDKERDIDLSEILTPVVTPEPTPTPEPIRLTPPGNMTLVDDITSEQANDKQFITVITKSGNYFYIVIDRAGDRENVHFLNLVDELDLLALIEDDKKPAAQPAPVTPAPEQTPEPEPAPEPKQNNTGSLLILLLLIGALGGGAYYYFKVLKPKQDAKGAAATELDEFAFDEDDDDFDNTAAYEQDSAEHEGDTDGDIPDFTAEPDNDGGDFNFDLGDFDTETPESEGNQ